MSSVPIVIIGNGIAGITAARNIRKRSDQRIIVISKESDYFFSRTALMYVFMGHLKWEHLEPYERSFWQKNNIELLRARVVKLETKSKELFIESGESIAYDSLIIASGSVPQTYNWKGENYEGVQSLYSKQDLEHLDKWSSTTKRAAIVGGGLIGIELAEMLSSRGIHVSLIVREDSFWNHVISRDEGRLLEEHFKAHGIELHLATQLSEIKADENGRVNKILTDTGQTLACEFVGLTTGVRPNISFLNHSDVQINRGVLVNEFLETNIPQVYAIGDCAELRHPPPNRKAIEAVWYTARMMGETLALTLTGKKTAYRPGHWFNSAKFFDIEYQTYGQISPSPYEKEIHFCWVKRNANLALRFAYAPNSKRFLGINTFGIRLRHEVFDQWLTAQVSIDHVISHLKEANFDPEFYSSYESQIIAKWLHQKN